MSDLNEIKAPDSNEIAAQCFSIDGETFAEGFDVVIDHCEENLEPGDEFSYEVGETREFTHSDFIHKYSLETFVESMQERAFDEVGEIAEIYLEYFATPEREKEFAELVGGFIQKHAGNPNVFGVKNIQTIKAVWDGENVVEVKEAA